ncbi:MAG: hypothetical protein LC650_02650 [Actinobacteria bacterium]|nr:hypothetical protein [Actinomycetota bacterium]
MGANVYERLQWVLKKIDAQHETIHRATREITRLRQTALQILEQQDSEELAVWFAEENAKRLGIKKQ